MDDPHPQDAKRIRTAAALILLYYIPVIPLVLYIYANAADAAEASPFRDLITSYCTMGTMILIMKAAIIATVIGGILGTASAALALRRRLWKATAALCLMSAVIAVFSLIGLVMILAAFRLLLKARPAFID